MISLLRQFLINSEKLSSSFEVINSLSEGHVVVKDTSFLSRETETRSIK